MSTFYRFIWSVSILLPLLGNNCFAVKSQDLNHLPTSSLKLFLSPQIDLVEANRELDCNNTLHVRFYQTYAGYPILGTDSVIHVPNLAQSQKNISLNKLMSLSKRSTFNGLVYQDLGNDLQGVSANYLFQKSQMDKALSSAILYYQKKAGHYKNISTLATKIIIFVDKNQKAHWCYLIKFRVNGSSKGIAQPNMILDATSFHVYSMWDGILRLSNVTGGGYGGNEKIGKFSYDGLPKNLPFLAMLRDDQTKKCYLQNDEVVIKDMKKNYAVSQFDCLAPDPFHNSIFWNNYQDTVNGGYSPSNDALRSVSLVNNMFQSWYGIPVYQNNKSKQLVAVIHFYNDGSGEDQDEATWGDDGQMSAALLGDGVSLFYPLTSLDVVAHEFGHGFTEQHSALTPMRLHSFSLNESFSDMTAKATEYFVTGHNEWQIGASITKAKDTAIRYMDNPTKDCDGRKPGDNCSMDKVQDLPDVDVFDPQYKDPHFGAGITNKAFYLIATSPGWDTKKAFDIMVDANRYYWVSTTSIPQAACGVLQAAHARKYPVQAVIEAFKKVGVEVGACGLVDG